MYQRLRFLRRLHAALLCLLILLLPSLLNPLLLILLRYGIWSMQTCSFVLLLHAVYALLMQALLWHLLHGMFRMRLLPRSSMSGLQYKFLPLLNGSMLLRRRLLPLSMCLTG